MTQFFAGTAFFYAALLVGVASGTSHSAQPSSGEAISGSPMQVEMLRIEQKTKQLQFQMQKLRNTTDRGERYRLLLTHLRSMREALDAMSNMEMKMVEDVNRGRIVSDPTLKRRQAVMTDVMDMMQLMLERMALFQEPALQ